MFFGVYFLRNVGYIGLLMISVGFAVFVRVVRYIKVWGMGRKIWNSVNICDIIGLNTSVGGTKGNKRVEVLWQNY